MTLLPQLSKREVEFLRQNRVARLATVSSAGMPHVVPVCYAFNGEDIYTTLHYKAKRLKNLKKCGKIALAVDEYSEEWSLLKGMLIQGDAQILDHGTDYLTGWRLLNEKYPQYDTWSDESGMPKDMGVRRIVKIRIVKAVSWGLQ